MSPVTQPTPERLEILDLLWTTDGATGHRHPRRAADVVAQLRSSGQNGAARIVATMGNRDGVLDEKAIDEVVLAVHYELSRLSEHLHVPHRMASVLVSMVAQMRERHGTGAMRVVDVGCGIGLNLRWMAAMGALGPDIEYAGVDLDPVVIEAATRLAAIESVPASFAVGDAFSMAAAVSDPARTIMVSQGLLHHVPLTRLEDFFAHHRDVGVGAFAHFDVNPGWWPVVGGGVLHQVRMRHPVSRHDGNVSLRRAYDATTLLEHAHAGVGQAYTLECDDHRGWFPAPHRALRPISGIRQ